MNEPMTPPSALLRACRDAREERALQSWWRRLDDVARRDLQASLRNRSRSLVLMIGEPLESAKYEYETAFGSKQQKRRDPFEPLDPVQDLREHLQGNPEVIFFLEEKTFHICHAQKRARRAVRKRKIRLHSPGCERSKKDCLLERILQEAGGEVAIQQVLIVPS